MIFIPGNVPSLKNSKVATSKGVFMSKTCRKYLQNIGIKKYGKDGVEGYKDYIERPNIFKQSVGNYFDNCPKPAIVGFHFSRGSKHKFDFHNAVQMIADLLVAHRFIEDDNMDFFIPIPFQIGLQWYTFNKQNPGVYLKMMDDYN